MEFIMELKGWLDGMSKFILQKKYKQEYLVWSFNPVMGKTISCKPLICMKNGKQQHFFSFEILIHFTRFILLLFNEKF